MCSVAKLCLTLCDPMDCILPGSSVHGIPQARILEWVAIPFSRGSSQPRDWTQVSCFAGRFFTVWPTKWPCVGNMKIDQRKHCPKWIMKNPYGYTDLFFSLRWSPDPNADILTWKEAWHHHCIIFIISISPCQSLSCTLKGFLVRLRKFSATQSRVCTKEWWMIGIQR